MLTDFAAVPDWFATENADGGAAVGDVTGDGQPDLLVFAIDAPAGQNTGRYRVGRGLAGGGDRRVGSVADRAGLAVLGEHRRRDHVADLDGSGRLDLVLFIVDAPAGPNIGLVRVARGLDADGVPTGGWGPWQTVPDWPFWESQGADCAVADVDGDGALELVLLVADNPVGQNRGLYRTSALAPDGTASGWSPWTSVPDWFGWENAGAGVAVGDLDGDGVPELLVLVVDSAVGENDAYYSVGWRLDGRGRPRRWLGALAEGARLGLPREPGRRGRPDRFGRRRRARPRRARRGQPRGTQRGLRPRIIPVETDLATAAAQGVWRILEIDSGVLAVHAALLHTGDVLFFAGSSNDPDAAAGRRYGTRVWHYPAPDMSAPDTPVDLFCCGHACLPDGRLLAAGGTERYDPFIGLRQAVVFDPAVGRWVPEPHIGKGRWYPTLVALPDGDVLAVSGLGADGFLSLIPERYDGAG